MSHPDSVQPGTQEWEDDPKTSRENERVGHLDTSNFPEDEITRIGEDTDSNTNATSLRLHGNQTGIKNACCSSCQRNGCVQGLWHTKAQNVTEQQKKPTVAEFIVYCIFLAVCCIVTHGSVSSYSYYYTQSMRSVFLTETRHSGFSHIHTFGDVWKYLRGPLALGVHEETWYNSQPLNQSQMGYVLHESKLLSAVQLRQLRVKIDSCDVRDEFNALIDHCYSPYSRGSEQQSSYGPLNSSYATNAWSYNKTVPGSQRGRADRYYSGGYVQLLGDTFNATQEVLSELESDLWLDRGTRALFIDFSMYNANLNLFCIVRLLLEFPATGGVLTSSYFWTQKLIRYSSTWDYVILACEMMFILFWIQYIIDMILKIRAERCDYVRCALRWIELMIVLLATLCVAFGIYRFVLIDSSLASLLSDPTVYTDMYSLTHWQRVFEVTAAIFLFFVWIKVVWFCALAGPAFLLTRALSRAARDLLGFSLLFAVVFLAYAQLGYLMFSAALADFSTFGFTCVTQFRMLLGDFDFGSLQTAFRVLGPLYFMSYVFLVYIILLSMFVAIIIDAFREVKAEGHSSQFFSSTPSCTSNCCNIFKRKHRKDISPPSDASDPKVFKEWRMKLRMQGHSEQEIEAIMSRFGVERTENSSPSRLASLRCEEAEGRKSAASGSFNSDDSDDEAGSRMSRSVLGRCESWGRPTPAVAYEEFTVLSRRVNRMEHSIGSIMSKIDAVLVKLEAMEKAKLKRRETMGRILDSITESDGQTEEMRREQMERLVRQELERWDSESSLQRASIGSSRPGSSSRPASSGRNASAYGYLPGMRIGSASSHGSTASSAATSSF